MLFENLISNEYKRQFTKQSKDNEANNSIIIQHLLPIMISSHSKLVHD